MGYKKNGVRYHNGLHFGKTKIKKYENNKFNNMVNF